MIERQLREAKINDLVKYVSLSKSLIKQYPQVPSIRLLMVMVLSEYCQLKETESRASLTTAKYLIADDLITELLISSEPFELIIQQCIGNNLLRKGILKKDRLHKLITLFLKNKETLTKNLDELISKNLSVIQDEKKDNLLDVLPINPIRSLYLKNLKNEITSPKNQKVLERKLEDFLNNNNEKPNRKILSIIYYCAKAANNTSKSLSVMEVHKINQILDLIIANPLLNINELINQILPDSMIKFMNIDKNGDFNNLLIKLKNIEKNIQNSIDSKDSLDHLQLLCLKYKEIYSIRRHWLVNAKNYLELSDEKAITLSGKNERGTTQWINKNTLYPIHQSKHTVKLYSNAYTDVTHSSGAFYDMMEAIKDAKKFICITSWNNTLTKNLGMEKTLGELLVDAATTGVKVYILIWDQTHSGQNKKLGIENNIKFLESSRNNNIFYKKSTRTDKLFNKRYYSHHQKILLTEKTVFISGMDFVSKAVDSKEHSDIGGVMWHDVSSQVQGCVILDVFEMFNSRWRSQPKELMLYNSDLTARKFLCEHFQYLQTQNFEDKSEQTTSLQELQQEEKKLSKSVGEKKESTCDDILEKKEAVRIEELMEKTEAKKTEQAYLQFLVSLSKADYQSPFKLWPLPNDYTDEIHESILRGIMLSENYIFIANQYFIGQYYGHENSPNKIAQALIARIIRAHQNKEEFHVYFTLPSVPGNKLEGMDVTTILRKQWKTLEYIILQVNEKTRNNAAMYLTFTELGVVHAEEYNQVYVHSKFLFTPSDFFVGSANFNERSLSGNRDSEAILHLHRYTAEIAEFRDNIIEEFYGTKVLSELKKQGLSGKIGSLKAQKIINDSITKRFAAIESKCQFIPNTNELLDSKKITSSQLIKELAGVALPWGLIPKQFLMLGKKPDRVPDKGSCIVSFINKLGFSHYTR